MPVAAEIPVCERGSLAVLPLKVCNIVITTDCTSKMSWGKRKRPSKAVKTRAFTSRGS
jgi:hypothetical protein